MNIRLFLITLTLFSLLMPAFAQQTRPSSRRKAKKAPISASQLPIIKSFKPSRPAAIIPCPWARFTHPFCPGDGLILKLMTEASDPKGDTLLYQYSVSGGRILGEGPNAEWNLTDAASGSYTATVVVRDRNGRSASSSLNINVSPCDACDPPCITVNVSCPDVADEGQSVIFTVNVSGGEPDVKATYKWSVSAGTIVNGQGTDTIEVSTSNLGGQQVEATVEVSGYPPECQNQASCKVQIRKKTSK